MPVTYPTMERLLRGVEPEARSRELTQAEKAQAFLEEQLAKITSKERARRLSMTAFGGAESGIPGGIGAVDFVPFLGSAKGLEEGVRDVNQAAYDLEAGRYGSALRNYGASALGMLPGAAGTLRAAPAVGRAAVDIARSPTAERALGRLAEATGAAPMYAAPKDYRGSHTAPGPHFGAPLHDVSSGGMYPSDFYGPKGRQYYGNEGWDFDANAFNKVLSYKNKPDAKVTIFRAVPKSVYKEAMKGESPLKQLIQPGDWITLSKEYAKAHGESALNNDYKIVQKIVPARQVWTNADSIHEWGYHPDMPNETGSIKAAPQGNYDLANLNKPKAVKGGLGYDQAKIAMQYPDVAPPELAIDKKTGKEFLQKQLSDEARAVEKARKAAQKDIDAGKYTPFFDVEKRYYADAAQHPLQGRTVTDALPKKQETIDKYRKQYDTPEARKRLTDAFKKGSQDPLTKDWYAMGQLEAEFIKEYGPEKGRNLFKEAFADAMAATTGGADPTSNMLMGYYGNYLRQQGIPQPTAAYEFPYPTGGRYASGNMAMYDKVINQGKGFQANKTPKRFDFSANFLGHRDRATIDEQMSGGFDPKLVVPPGDSYGVFEAVVHDLAKQQGVQPANFQDVSWAGLKGTKGKPMIQHVNEAIERTARVTGKTPEEVVRDSLVRRTHPLYGVAGTGLTAGALAAAARDQRGDEM